MGESRIGDGLRSAHAANLIGVFHRAQAHDHAVPVSAKDAEGDPSSQANSFSSRAELRKGHRVLDAERCASARGRRLAQSRRHVSSQKDRATFA